ncbi:MAG: transposase [Cetobacterium sp.]|uniref:RNA-guided endonuclease InsQ/TnpB family protein n=1 Tax=Bacteria TaxID=2 RepID=UPI002FCA528D
MITTRKLKVICSDKDFYSFLNQEQREQNKALNIGISLIHSGNSLRSIDSGAEARITRGISKLELKLAKLALDLKKEKITEKKKSQILKAIETNKEIIAGERKILDEGNKYRIGIDKQFNELYIDKTNLYHVLDSLCNIQYKRTIELVRQKIGQDYSNNFVDIVTGKMSLPNYKSDFPLMVDGKCISIIRELDEVGIPKGYGIKIMLGYELIIILGQRVNENILELKKTLEKCISGEYKICASSIQRDRNNNVIINLCLDIPIENKYEPKENRVLGVDLGIKYPVYMCLGDDTYKRESVGSINNFLRIRQQMQERRKKLQKELNLTNGGKGRAKKLQALDKLKDNERNFAKTYNHAISKRVVSFAKQHKCEFINLERLTKDGFNNVILRNWSFFELQKMIEYKSKREGITVRYINPSYTSQMCSNCRHVDKENRQTQEDFICTECGFKLNADHNAAINIARSQDFKNKLPDEELKIG